MLTVQQVFDLGLKMGMVADPRGEKIAKKTLERAKKEYEELKSDEKEYFDKERLINPYSDSRIHAGDPKTSVKRVMAGIDIGSEEILLASQLNERGKDIDLIIAHHPIGQSLADLHSVMEMLIDIYVGHGVPVHVAEKVFEDRIKEVGRGVHPINHFQIIDTANLLKANLINTHTFTDNLVEKYIHEAIAKEKPENIGELLKLLLKIPEYQEAKRRGSGPRLFTGSNNRRVGKFIVDMTGGTSPSHRVYQELSRAGISTIVGMHINESSTEKANEFNLNVVIAGHISSDSLGMNLYLDELEKKGIEIVPFGGLIRVSRGKKSTEK